MLQIRGILAQNAKNPQILRRLFVFLIKVWTIFLILLFNYTCHHRVIVRVCLSHKKTLETMTFKIN